MLRRSTNERPILLFIWFGHARLWLGMIREPNKKAIVGVSHYALRGCSFPVMDAILLWELFSLCKRCSKSTQQRHFLAHSTTKACSTNNTGVIKNTFCGWNRFIIDTQYTSMWTWMTVAHDMPINTIRKKIIFLDIIDYLPEPLAPLIRQLANCNWYYSMMKLVWQAACFTYLWNDIWFHLYRGPSRSIITIALLCHDNLSIQLQVYCC